jgi:hypothetical protein
LSRRGNLNELHEPYQLNQLNEPNKLRLVLVSPSLHRHCEQPARLPSLKPWRKQAKAWHTPNCHCESRLVGACQSRRTPRTLRTQPTQRTQQTSSRPCEPHAPPSLRLLHNVKDMPISTNSTNPMDSTNSTNPTNSLSASASPSQGEGRGNLSILWPTLWSLFQGNEDSSSSERNLVLPRALEGI